MLRCEVRKTVRWAIVRHARNGGARIRSRRTHPMPWMADGLWPRPRSCDCHIDLEKAARPEFLWQDFSWGVAPKVSFLQYPKCFQDGSWLFGSKWTFFPTAECSSLQPQAWAHGGFLRYLPVPNSWGKHKLSQAPQPKQQMLKKSYQPGDILV